LALHKLHTSKIGVIIAGAYLLLVILLLLIFVKEKEVAGFYLLLFTLPWSVIYAMVSNFATEAYHYRLPLSLTVIILCIFAVINALLICHLASRRKQ